MPRESIDHVRRLLEDADQHVRVPPPVPDAQRRRRVHLTPPALASTFINRRVGNTMHYVFTRRFDLQMGGDFLVTLPCLWGESQNPKQIMFRDPAHDLRIFWFPNRAPDRPFAVDRGALQVSDPKSGFVTIGKVTARDLVNELWPVDGPLRGLGGKQ